MDAGAEVLSKSKRDGRVSRRTLLPTRWDKGSHGYPYRIRSMTKDVTMNEMGGLVSAERQLDLNRRQDADLTILTK